MSGDVSLLALAAAAILFGGLLKGVTGLGGPLVAVPLIASMSSVPVALAIMVVPGIVSNIWQLWISRTAREGRRALWRMLVGCAIGALLGTTLLGILPDALLSGFLALLILTYLALRVAKPSLQLDPEVARRAAVPVGLATGLLQGAAGMSAPVGATFIVAQRLSRESQIFAMSAMFLALGAGQSISLVAIGFMTWEIFALSTAGVVPMFLGIAIGQRLGRRLGAAFFERLTVGLLLVAAAALLVKAARAMPG